jgi:hypothetical protein
MLKKIKKTPERIPTDDDSIDMSGLEHVDQRRHSVLWPEQTFLVVISTLEHLLLGRLQAFGNQWLYVS